MEAGTEGGQSSGWSGLTAAAVFIGAVPAVVCPITHPELGDAAVVVALKLHGVAELVWERRGRVRSKTMQGEGRNGDGHWSYRTSGGFPALQLEMFPSS